MTVTEQQGNDKQQGGLVDTPAEDKRRSASLRRSPARQPQLAQQQ